MITPNSRDSSPVPSGTTTTYDSISLATLDLEDGDNISIPSGPTTTYNSSDLRYLDRLRNGENSPRENTPTLSEAKLVADEDMPVKTSCFSVIRRILSFRFSRFFRSRQSHPESEASLLKGHIHFDPNPCG